MKGWRTPKRIVMATGIPLRRRSSTLSAPGVEIVTVKSTEEMIAQAANADAIVGGDNVVCDERVLAAAKKVRWVAVMSAGVEECLGKAGARTPGI